MAMFITEVMPYEWNRGNAPMVTSLASRARDQRKPHRALDTRLRWVSWVPFGTPVVPPV
jgi:hypothetical protein